MENEDDMHWRMILTEPGMPWSGRTRYAAAMHFYQSGEMTPEVLEIYRICSRIDAEDPVDALKTYRMGADWINRIEQARRNASAYLSTKQQNI